MLNFLFGALTARSAQGAALFDAATGIAREPHWYVAGKVPDTLEGRFAMLATVSALVMLRLEAQGEKGEHLSVALAERFVEVMESEHRELGQGDPTLGKTVRKLVGSLARRLDLWRAAIAGGCWEDAAQASVAGGEPIHLAGSLRQVWQRLERTDVGALAEGRIA